MNKDILFFKCDALSMQSVTFRMTTISYKQHKCMTLHSITKSMSLLLSQTINLSNKDLSTFHILLSSMPLMSHCPVMWSCNEILPCIRAWGLREAYRETLTLKSGFSESKFQSHGCINVLYKCKTVAFRADNWYWPQECNLISCESKQ